MTLESTHRILICRGRKNGRRVWEVGFFDPMPRAQALRQSRVLRKLFPFSEYKVVKLAR